MKLQITRFGPVSTLLLTAPRLPTLQQRTTSFGEPIVRLAFEFVPAQTVLVVIAGAAP